MKILVAVPCLEMVSTDFMQSLLALRPPQGKQMEIGLTKSSLVYDARNNLCARAINQGFDRVLWIDSDMVFEDDLAIRLSARLDEGKEFVTGLCFRRRPPYSPAIFSEVGVNPEENGSVTPFAKTFEDYPKNSLFRVISTGCAGAMMSVDLIKKVQDRYGLPFSPITGFGEDLSFCLRATDIGAEIWCDSSVKLGHISQTIITEETWEGSR